MDIGFIGLGSMGSRIVDLLLDGGHTVTVWARRAASIEPFAGRVQEAGSPREVAERSDLVGLCVWDETDVEDVLLRDDGVAAGLRPGGLVTIHSTIPPGACQRLAAEVEERGGALIDAPVSVGSNLPKLLVMVGGPAGTVDRCRPALDAIGKPVVHLGPVGSGQIAKLVNNTMMTAEIGLGEDAVAMGQALGLDPQALAQALGAGSSGTSAWSHFVSAAPNRPTGRAGTDWARKDVGAATALAASAGLDVNREVLRLAGLGVAIVEGG